MMGNSANTFKDSDPLGMMECWKRGIQRTVVATLAPNIAPMCPTAEHHRVEIKGRENSDSSL